MVLQLIAFLLSPRKSELLEARIMECLSTCLVLAFYLANNSSVNVNVEQHYCTQGQCVWKMLTGTVTWD